VTRRTRTAWVSGAAALALALAACGGDDGDDADQERSLTVWIMDPGNPVVEEIVNGTARAFEEQHEGVTVEIEYVPWPQAHDQFATAIAGGVVPDVAEMGTTWTPEFAALGAFDPVEPAAGVAYVPALMGSGTVGGANYGYPWYAGARALIYRTDIFEQIGAEPPATWDDVLAVGEQIAEADLDVAPIHVAGEYQHFLIPLIWGAGGEVATEQGGTWEPGVDSDAGRAAFAFYQELWETGWTPDGGISWTSVDVREAFTNEQSAMMVAGGWDLANILDNNPDLEGRVGVTLMPAGPAGNRDAFAGGSHLVVFEESPNQNLAHEFAQFMISPEQVTNFTGQIGFLPGTADGVQAAVGGDDLYSTFGVQLVEHSRSYPAAAWWGQVEGDRTFINEVQRLLQGDQTVEEAVANIDAAIRAAIG
jgi:N,N'-diacetylchitobiose transport system substrate-binding protein